MYICAYRVTSSKIDNDKLAAGQPAYIVSPTNQT